MKYHNVNLKIADEPRNQEQKHEKELKLVTGAIAGIGLFTVTTAHNNNIANADTDTSIVSNANSVSEHSAQSQSVNSSTSVQSSQATSSITGNNSSVNHSLASAESSSTDSVSGYSSSTSANFSSDDQAISYRDGSSSITSNPSSASSSDSTTNSSNATIDSSADNSQTHVETEIQHTVTIKGTDNTEHPYVVSGSNGQTVTLPNGQSVKIAGNQLVDPATNQPFNNNDNFDQGAFTPDYKDYTIQIRFKFVDENNNPVAVNYNNNNPSGYQTYKVTARGYDGEPFSLYYKYIIANQFNGFEPQQIANQNDATYGPYVQAILGHGLMNGNDSIILKGIPEYAKVRYYVTTNDGSIRYFDTNQVQTTYGYNSQQVDVQTPFNNYNNGIKLSDYFNLPNNLSQYTFQANTSETNPAIIDVNLIPKPITQTLRVLVRSTVNSNDTYPATITMTGSYGNKSSYFIQSNSLHFDNVNPLTESEYNTFLSENTRVIATLGADSNGNNANYGQNIHLWQEDNSNPNLTWDNPNDPTTATPVVYYTPVNSPNQVKVPNLIFNLRFWGPKNLNGSGYDPTNSDNNISGDPYNADNMTQTGLTNAKNGAINYRTYYNWPVTSDKYAPVNTIYDEYQWSYPGFTSDGNQNHILIQLTSQGPVQLYVDPNISGTILENKNRSDDRKYIALQGFPNQIPNVQNTTINNVNGYLIPKSAFGYQGADSDGTIFYPARARILSEWTSGQILTYYNGNYYYGDDSNFKNPVQLKTTINQPKQVSTDDSAYYVGDVNNYAQANQITLKYLDTDNVDPKNPTISASNLPNANLISSKSITAYTEDRIYYDQNQNAFFLTRYGKVGQEGQINTDLDSVTTKLFDAPAGYNYDNFTQSNYANYNYQIDQSQFGGLSVASWIAGVDSPININVTSNEMHPYGPDGTNNVAAVYMRSNGTQMHNVVVNLAYVNLPVGKLIDSDTKNETYDPKNPNALNDLSTYFQISKSPYGTPIINDSRFSDYKYVASFSYSSFTDNNRLKTLFIYLSPFDPNDPNSQLPNIQPYPLTIHYVDEQGNPIDESSHDLKLTGVKSQTINEAMQGHNESLWDYRNENYERVGIKLDLLDNNYYDDNQIESLFNNDSSSNDNQIFGKHLDVYIVLRTKYNPSSGIPNNYPSDANGDGGKASSNSTPSSSATPITPNPNPSSAPSSAKPTNNGSSNNESQNSSAVIHGGSATAVSVVSSNTISASSTTSSTTSNSINTASSDNSVSISSTTSSSSSASGSNASSSTSSSSSASGSNASSSTSSSSSSNTSTPLSSTSFSSSSNTSNPLSSTSFSSYSNTSTPPSSTSSSSYSNTSTPPNLTSFSNTSSSSNPPSSNRHQDELPQTGETSPIRKYRLIGIALIAFSGILFSSAMRKRRKK